MLAEHAIETLRPARIGVEDAFVSMVRADASSSRTKGTQGTLGKRAENEASGA